MKKITSITVVLLAFTAVIQAQSWIQLTSGTTKDLRDVYFSTPQIGYVVGKDSILLKTTDGGNTWNTLLFPGVDHYPSNQGSISAVSFWNTQDGMLMYSFNNAPVATTDGGNTWDTVGPGMTPLCSGDGLELWGGNQGAHWGRGCFGGAYLSFFNGTDWDAPQLLYYGPMQSGIVNLARDTVGQRMFAGIFEGYLFRSSDQFLNYDTVKIADTIVWDIEWVQGDTLYALRTDNMYPLLISTDGGDTFVADQNWMSTFAYPTLYDIDMAGPQAGFIAAQGLVDQGMLWHIDPVMGWSYQMVDRPMNKVFAVSPTLAFAVGDSGQIYKYEATLGLDDKTPASADAFTLSPNPVSGGADIKISGDVPFPVSYAITDIQGRQVAKGLLNTPVIPSSGLTPGIYLLSLEGFSGSKRLIIN